VKQTLKKVIPSAILNWYRNTKRAKLSKKSTKEVFTDIYQSNHWNSDESISGIGSQLNQTETLINALNSLFLNKDYDIKSFLDIPCGDFNWIKHVDLSQIQYLGADIVEALIQKNKEQYKNDNINFEVLNLIDDVLPKSDVVFVRDCLVHLSYDDIAKAIKNIKDSGSKYLLTTTFTDHENRDILTGEWRAINLQKAPFNFSEPLLIINENCTEGDGILEDKSMALWDIDKLPIII